MFDTNDILWVAYNKVNGLMFKGTEVFPPYTVSKHLFFFKTNTKVLLLVVHSIRADCVAYWTSK